MWPFKRYVTSDELRTYQEFLEKVFDKLKSNIVGHVQDANKPLRQKIKILEKHIGRLEAEHKKLVKFVVDELAKVVKDEETRRAKEKSTKKKPTFKKRRISGRADGI